MRTSIPMLLLGCVLLSVGNARDLRITSLSLDGTLTWTNSAANGSAAILFSTNLQPDSWLPSRHVSTTGCVTTVSLPPPHPPAAYYRIQMSDTATVPAGMALIPGGPFKMGDSYEQGFTNARPAHMVHVSGFFIDQYEVTNEDLRHTFQWAFEHGLINGTATTITNTEGDPRELLDLDNSDHGIPATRITFSNGQLSIAAGFERHPVTGVTWYGAQAYCNYRSDMEPLERCITFTNRISQWISGWVCDFAKKGYRLPTEAEWEKAARGGLTSHHYPWESYGASYSTYLSHAKAHYGSGITNKPVGSYEPNAYGLYDMAGNVWEWVWDYYKANWYSQPGATANDVAGPVGPWTGTEWLMSKVIRGGSVGYYDGVYLTCACRHGQGYGPSYDNWVVGFRCARTP